MKECPCRYCEHRYTACHDTCEDYITWKAEWVRLKSTHYGDMIAANYLAGRNLSMKYKPKRRKKK